MFVPGFVCLTNEAQTTTYPCNGKYRIELPNKLEHQSSKLNSVKRISEQGKKLQVIITTQSDHITFQQKGLNDDVKEAYNKYCRVIVEYFKEDRNDVFHILNRYENFIQTFSYREAERKMWKSIHDNIIKTFSFAKKYCKPSANPCP